MDLTAAASTTSRLLCAPAALGRRCRCHRRACSCSRVQSSTTPVALAALALRSRRVGHRGQRERGSCQQINKWWSSCPWLLGALQLPTQSPATTAVLRPRPPPVTCAAAAVPRWVRACPVAVPTARRRRQGALPVPRPQQQPRLRQTETAAWLALRLQHWSSWQSPAVAAGCATHTLQRCHTMPAAPSAAAAAPPAAAPRRMPVAWFPPTATPAPPAAGTRPACPPSPPAIGGGTGSMPSPAALLAAGGRCPAVPRLGLDRASPLHLFEWNV